MYFLSIHSARDYADKLIFEHTSGGIHTMWYSETDSTGILSEIVTAARTGDYSNISTLLNKGVIAIQEDLKKGPVDEKNLKKISYSLETIIAMQQMQNWVALADILEYEFIPLWNTLNW